MPIADIFSKRELRRENKVQDVYQYTELPRTLRIQVIHIWKTAIGEYQALQHLYSPSNRLWDQINNILSREYGFFSLGDSRRNAYVQCRDFILNCDTYHALDLIELTFRTIDTVIREFNHNDIRASNISQKPDDAILELNQRFHENSVGYQYASGELIRVDSQFLHKEAVVPAVSLLHEHDFSGASEEFLRAHEHYRHGRNKEAIVDALKAFESTMKSICDKRQWPYDKNSPAKKLIDVIVDKGLIPSELLSQFTALRSVLQDGLPTVRNKTSGHGQGITPVPVPNYLASFALHMAAANIVFLVEAHKALK